jgi:hypothetical protein
MLRGQARAAAAHISEMPGRADTEFARSFEIEAMRCTVAERLRATASFIVALPSPATLRSTTLYIVNLWRDVDDTASATSMVPAHAPARARICAASDASWHRWGVALRTLTLHRQACLVHKGQLEPPGAQQRSVASERTHEQRRQPLRQESHGVCLAGHDLQQLCERRIS